MRFSACLASLTLVLLSACSTKVVRVDMDAAQLEAARSSSHDAVTLACDYRLGNITDARTGGGDAGGLGGFAFEFSDAADIVRQQLLAAALLDNGESPVVDVRIVQLYLTQNRGTKVPVAVYQVDLAGHPGFLLRSQKPTANWSGSRNEAYAAYARVLEDVNQQLIRRLNSHCPKV